MKKAICFDCLPADLDAAGRMRLAKDAGYHGVEIGTVDEEGAAELARLAADVGVKIHSVMDSLHWQCPMSSPDTEIRRRGMEHIKKSIRAAAATGADAVLVVPGVVGDDTTYEEAWGRSGESLSELAPYAVEHQVTIAVENVWNRFLLSPREMVEYIDAVGSPYVAAYFDVGNILAYGQPEQWILSLGPRLKKVHLKDFSRGEHRFVYLLQGDVPWPKVMRALGSVGYDGYLTAEMAPYPGCPGVAVHDISRHIDHLLGML